MATSDGSTLNPVSTTTADGSISVAAAGQSVDSERPATLSSDDTDFEAPSSRLPPRPVVRTEPQVSIGGGTAPYLVVRTEPQGTGGSNATHSWQIPSQGSGGLVGTPVGRTGPQDSTTGHEISASGRANEYGPLANRSDSSRGSRDVRQYARSLAHPPARTPC